jgi:hypothetical protein
MGVKKICLSAEVNMSKSLMIGEEASYAAISPLLTLRAALCMIAIDRLEWWPDRPSPKGI